MTAVKESDIWWGTYELKITALLLAMPDLHHLQSTASNQLEARWQLYASLGEWQVVSFRIIGMPVIFLKVLLTKENLLFVVKTSCMMLTYYGQKIDFLCKWFRKYLKGVLLTLIFPIFYSGSTMCIWTSKICYVQMPLYW